MFQNFNIKVDADKYKEQLKEFDRQMPRISRRMMGRVLSEVKKQIKARKLKGQVLHKQTGELEKSLKFKTQKNFMGTFMVRAYYASWHESQYTFIEAQKHKYLTFQIDGEWKKVKRVFLPYRPFALPVLHDVWDSSQGVLLMDELLQLEMNKLLGDK